MIDFKEETLYFYSVTLRYGTHSFFLWMLSLKRRTLIQTLPSRLILMISIKTYIGLIKGRFSAKKQYRKETCAEKDILGRL